MYKNLIFKIFLDPEGEGMPPDPLSLACFAHYLVFQCYVQILVDLPLQFNLAPPTLKTIPTPLLWKIEAKFIMC